MKYYITGTRRGLGLALKEKYGTVDSLEDCNIFINCKHDGYQQVDLLYKAVMMYKRVINIGSNSPDQNKYDPHPYQIEKTALDKANDQLYYQGASTTIVRFGYFDSPRVANVEAPKMSIDYCVEIIDWVINQEHRVKEITVTP